MKTTQPPGDTARLSRARILATGLLTVIGLAPAVGAADRWRGTYDWGAETNSVSLTLQRQGERLTAIGFVAAYKEDTSTGLIRIKRHEPSGELTGLATVDGDDYRFTGVLAESQLTGRFARKEFDDWLDEGGLSCRPVAKEVNHAD